MASCALLRLGSLIPDQAINLSMEQLRGSVN